MKFIIFIIILSSTINATEENEVIATLWHELGHPTTSNQSYSKTPNPAVKIKLKNEKSLSPGQKKLEEIKARNRRIIKQKKVETHTSTNSYEENTNGLGYYRNLVKKTRSEQRRLINNNRALWLESRNNFLKNLSQYKDNTFEIQSVSNKLNSTSVNLLPPNLKLEKERDYYVIKNAFNIDVKDQGKRPTCSAFAGASAIEILLRQSSSNLKVSEQYLYWSSKPTCQQSPCSKKGSWISFAYNKSSSSKVFDIPTENDCPYSPLPLRGNETQIPLKNGCKNGKIKVDKYKEISNSIELYKSLNNNHPVIIGVKLSPNFYTTSGVITYQDSLVNGKIDQHAKGHALLLIGHMKLPSKLNSEGKLCYITVNSWTKGWGAGGYGCITEKWLSKYKVRNPFMALTNVRSL